MVVDDELSGGVIAGIVIAIVVALVLLVVLVVLLIMCLMLRKKNRSGKFNPSYETQGSSAPKLTYEIPANFSVSHEHVV